MVAASDSVRGFSSKVNRTVSLECGCGWIGKEGEAGYRCASGELCDIEIMVAVVVRVVDEVLELELELELELDWIGLD